LLAGGSGSRLFPLTASVSKQLLPIFDKPLVYYPLSTLMLSGIQEILVITRPDHLVMFQNLLSDGSQFGISIKYKIQNEPKGIAQAITLAEEFIGNEPFGLILGDNIFYGPGLGRHLLNFNNPKGATIFGYRVSNPSDYGVVEISETGAPTSIQEKPVNPKSNIAITGLYFFSSEAVTIASTLKPSIRGELEITDVLKEFLLKERLDLTTLPTGTAWLDTGTFQGLNDASTFVRIMEERTGSRIGDPTDVAIAQGWIRT